MVYTWDGLSIDERMVLPNVSRQWPTSLDEIQGRVQRTASLTAHTSFGRARTRRTLRSLAAKNLVVPRGRSMWLLHLEGEQLMDAADVRTGLRKRLV